MKDYITETFNNQPIVQVSGKKYCINSITDHLPITQPELLQQIINEMTEKTDYQREYTPKHGKFKK